MLLGTTKSVHNLFAACFNRKATSQDEDAMRGPCGMCDRHTNDYVREGIRLEVGYRDASASKASYEAYVGHTLFTKCYSI